MVTKIKIENIPNQEKANEIMAKPNMANTTRFTAITRLTGLCFTCHEAPAVKKVMYKIEGGGWKVEKYCLEHFHHSAYDKPKKRVKIGKN